MKGLFTLMRNKPSIDQTCRRTFGNVNMVRRKDLRRIRKLNIYNKQLSGQSNPNQWFTPKKLKAVANHIETVKNNHIGTNPIPQQKKKQLLQVMTQLSQYQYYNFRNREKQLVQYQDLAKSCNIQHMISQMPAKLRKQVQAAQPIPQPEINQPLLKYIEQLQVFLPVDQKRRYNLLQKLKHPPRLKLEEQFN